MANPQPTLPGMRGHLGQSLSGARDLRDGEALVVTIPGIKLESPNTHYFGSRRAMFAQAKKIKKTRGDVAMVLRSRFGTPPAPPLLVTITRISPAELDDDNLARSGKAVRDGVADWLGVDDRTKRGGVAWKYAEAQAGKGIYGVTIRIEARAA